MSSGGIIIQGRAAALLIALTESSWYDSMSAEDKSVVDAIDAKDPAGRTQEDLNTLLRILNTYNGS